MQENEQIGTNSASYVTVEPTVGNKPSNKKGTENLVPFKKNDPYQHELARKGGLVRSPEKRIQALLNRYRRREAIAYAAFADISPKAALALMGVFLDRGRYRNFLANELFELLGATNGYFEKTIVSSTFKDSEGKLHVDHSNKERKEAILLKMRVVALLLKAGNAFFPEMRDNHFQAVQVNIMEKEPTVIIPAATEEK